MARPGKSIAKQSEGRAGEKCLPVGGRVKKLRAVGHQPGSRPKEGNEQAWKDHFVVAVLVLEHRTDSKEEPQFHTGFRQGYRGQCAAVTTCPLIPPHKRTTQSASHRASVPSRH